MNFKEDPKNLIIPLDLAKIINNPCWDAELHATYDGLWD